MDFGIQDFLNIEVDFEKSKYHLKDVIKGTF